MMRWLRLGVLEGVSPLGVLVAGLAIGTVGLPVLKKGLRALTLVTAKGVVTVADQVKDAGEKLGQEWNQVVTEVGTQREKRRAAVRAGLHGAGVGVIKTGIGLAEQAKGKIEGIKEEWRELVEEARSDLKGLEEVVGAATTSAPSLVAVENHVEEAAKEDIRKNGEVTKDDI